jgi:CheY-like chemotaxis protein
MNRTERKTRVLIVDDSAVARRAISEALARDPEIEVVGAASDAYVARDQILALQPDVVTLDLEMPRMDGLSFLKILQEYYPVPVVVVSSLTPSGSAKALEALAAGALDVLAKPDGSGNLGQLANRLAYHVKAAAQSRRAAPRLRLPTDPAVPVGSYLLDPPQGASRLCASCCRAYPTDYRQSWWCSTFHRIFPAPWPITWMTCARSPCARPWMARDCSLACAWWRPATFISH